MGHIPVISDWKSAPSGYYVSKIRNGHEINIKPSPEDFQDGLKWNTHVPQVVEFLHKNKRGFSHYYGEFSMRMHCFFNLRRKMEGKYKSFMDIIGGLGHTGKIFQTSPEETFLNDLDDSCVKILKDNFMPDNVTQHDANDYPYKRNYDAMLADCNDLTVKKRDSVYGSFLNGMFTHSDRYVILTDSTIFALKYGKHKFFKQYEPEFGEYEHTLSGFYAAMGEWYNKLYPDWHLINVEYFNSASYFLFEKNNDRGLEVHKNTRDEMQLERPLMLTHSDVYEWQWENND